MDTTDSINTVSNETVRIVKRVIIKKVAIHLAVAVASTAAVALIASLSEKHHEKKEEETTED